MCLRTLMASLTALGAGGMASAQELEVIGQPVDGLMGFQPAATELMRDIHSAVEPDSVNEAIARTPR